MDLDSLESLQHFKKVAQDRSDYWLQVEEEASLAITLLEPDRTNVLVAIMPGTSITEIWRRHESKEHCICVDPTGVLKVGDVVLVGDDNRLALVVRTSVDTREDWPRDYVSAVMRPEWV